LLKLAPDLQVYVRDGRLSVGHAKVILGLTRVEEQKLAADRVLKHSLNVRQTEDLVARLQNPGAAPARGKAGALSPVKDAHVAELERRLQERFGTKVDLRYRQGKGALQIHFFTDADLERVLETVGVKLE
jgi:ParB family chromosome partitioning protein